MGVKDGPQCPGCGLPNYEGLCSVCRGNEEEARLEGLPYPWNDPDIEDDPFQDNRGL
jgi:hypothetical protein